MTSTRPPTRRSEVEIVGIDVGGANLKYACTDGRVLDRTFPMWTHWKELADQLETDLRELCISIDQYGHDCSRRLAVTMTGELADCFACRREGVEHIVDHVLLAASRIGIGKVGFYSTAGEFVSGDAAKQQVDSVAASNWHALARFVASHLQSDVLLIDVGSTTSDVIAVANERVLTNARTDHTRLQDGSLVYVGCRRTPICALMNEVRYHSAPIPLMNEVFATIDDARLVLGNQPELPYDLVTADGRPRDRESAKRRLAKMIGLDADELSDSDVEGLAIQIQEAASLKLKASIQSWWSALRSQSSDRSSKDSREPMVVLSGHGQDMVDCRSWLGEVPCVDLRDRIGGDVSRCAPSWAVAHLATKFLPFPSDSEACGVQREGTL